MMAIQSQYPTNVFLNNRSLQEDRQDYSLQPQVKEEGIDSRVLDHQSPRDIYFNNFSVGSCGINPRKKVDMNQLIDITQLHSRSAGVNTGLRLAFSDHRRNSMLISKDFSSQIEQQRDEIEHFLQIQVDEMRRTLVEKSRKHYHALLEAADVAVSRRLKEKDSEVVKAAWRKSELEARMAQVSMEAEIWRERVAAQEVEVAALQAQLQQAIMSGGGRRRLAEVDAGMLTCANVDTQDAESAYIDPERVVVVSGPSCKSCGEQAASVVLLPCRHLCICRDCNDVVLTCPLCFSLKSSSIEVYRS